MAELYNEDQYAAIWEITGQVADLIDIYNQCDETCRILIEQALESGNLGSARYRRQRLAAIRRFLSDTQDQAIPLANEVIRTAYAGSASNAARKIGALTPEFGGGIHREALEILADNLAAGLNGAAETVGRQIDDFLRRAGLNAAAQSILLGASAREGAEALATGLRSAGITAFIDAGGREWKLANYAQMVIRTNTADAIVRGNVNVAVENGYNIVEVLVIEDERLCEICGPYDGNVYSLTEGSEYETLTELPPFHPNCRCDINILTEPPEPEPEPFDYSEAQDLPSVQSFMENYARTSINELAREQSRLFERVIKDRRFDAKPKVLDGAAFDAADRARFDNAAGIAQSDLYRGVSDFQDRSAADLVSDFRDGELFIGDGVIGRGTYSSPEYIIADSFRGLSDETGEIITMRLAPDARIIDLATANRMRRNTINQIDNDYLEEVRYINDNFADPTFADERRKLLQAAEKTRDSQRALQGNPTQWALMNGYDAVWDDSYPQMVILNRGKVLIRRRNR
jgi:SPP1 gp7 family putative phage head morphogenesis protein